MYIMNGRLIIYGNIEKTTNNGLSAFLVALQLTIIKRPWAIISDNDNLTANGHSQSP